MAEFVAFVDGSSHGNPGPAGIGAVISDSLGQTFTLARWIGRQDNNVAEYMALLEVLQWAVARRVRSLHVLSDSQVVVRQMTGEYVSRRPPLYSLNWVCRKLIRSLEFSIEHIPRARNREANRLANDAARSTLEHVRARLMRRPV